MNSMEVFLLNRNRASVLWLVGLLFICLMSAQVWADAGQGATIKKQAATTVSNPVKVLPLKSFKDCSDCPEMVVLPAGQFMMGLTKQDADKDGMPNFLYKLDSPIYPHHESVKSFALGRYDVTKAEFAKFVQETGYTPPAGCKSIVKAQPPYTGYTWDSVSNANWKNPGFKQTDRDPVVCVSWNDAQQYVKWLNTKVSQSAEGKKVRYRLPSEVEWEYAARAGTTTLRYWGDSANEQCKYANGQDLSYVESFGEGMNKNAKASCRDGFATTSPVGSFKPNAWSLYDMLGNVEQLIEEGDKFVSSFGLPASQSDIQKWRETKRILRGGSWSSVSWGVIAADRDVVDVDKRESDNGFRVARDAQ